MIRAWLAKWSLPPLDDQLDGAEVARFLDRNRAVAGRYVDWAAAWRTWRANAERFAQERAQRQGGPSSPRGGGSPRDPDEQGPDGLTDAERARMRHRGRTETPPPRVIAESVVQLVEYLDDKPVSFNECVGIARGMGRDPHEVHDEMERARLARVAMRDAVRPAPVAPEGDS